MPPNDDEMAGLLAMNMSIDVVKLRDDDPVEGRAVLGRLIE